MTKNNTPTMKEHQKRYHLDNEEVALLQSVEEGTYSTIENLDTEIVLHSSYARADLAKKKAISIRLPLATILDIKARAAREGIPYQTYMGAVLFKETLKPMP